MDPVSIIGLASSVLGIVDVISKNVSSVLGLQSKYRQANLTVSLLIGQLSTLKAALNQISEWIDCDLNRSQHEQLVSDLTVAIQGCKILILAIDTRVQELHKDDSNAHLSRMGKEESEIKEYLNHLNNQINAFNLLLTAIQCRSTFEQHDLLNRRDSRRIMTLVKEDASSLLMIGDADSIRSGRSASTRNSKLVDVVFDFDQEIFNSNAYRGALQSNMAQILSQKKTTGPSPQEPGPVHIGSDSLDHEGIFVLIQSETHTASKILPEATDENFDPRISNPEAVKNQDTGTKQSFGRLMNGKFIQGASSQPSSAREQSSPRADRRSWFAQKLEKKMTPQGYWPLPTLSEEQKIDELQTSMEALRLPKPERKILLLGTGSSGKTTLIKSMQMLWPSGEPGGSLSPSEWTDNIKSGLIIDACLIMRAMNSRDLPYENFTDQASLFDHEGDAQYENPHFDSNVALAIEKLWNDRAVQRAWEESSDFVREADGLGHTAYFCNSVQRISSEDYVPSDRDIFWARVRTAGIHATKFESETGTLNVFDVGGEQPERRKWIHVMENVNVLVFVADIVGYSRRLYENAYTTDIRESLILFHSMANSQRFTNSPIIVLFTKFDKFGIQLEKFPLANVFPDYLDGSNIEAAKSYLTKKFVSLVPQTKRPICVAYTSIAEDLASTARVVARGIEHFEKNLFVDGGDSEKTYYEKNTSYFVMDEDGLPVYHSNSVCPVIQLDNKNYDSSYYPGGTTTTGTETVWNWLSTMKT